MGFDPAPTATQIVEHIIESAEDYTPILEPPDVDAPADHVVVTTISGKFYITAYQIE